MHAPMIGIRRTFAMLLAALVATDALAVVTTTVVDIPVAGATQRFLYVKPDAPIANIVSVPGGDGILGIQNDGTMTTVVGACNPVGRVRQGLAERSFAIALVDANSRGEVRNRDDVLEVIRYMRARHDVPTWIIGGSSATLAVTDLAASLPGDIPGGVIFVSPDRPVGTAAGLIRRPALVVHHALDTLAFGSATYNALTSAPVRERVSITGGTDAGCGYHLFNGTEAEFLAATASFIEKHNASTLPAPVRNYQGLWWNPAENGWGVNFSHQGNILFATLFTYDANRAPLWLVMSNGVMQSDGVSFTGELYRTTGPAFNANPFTPIGPANLTLVGTMTASFADVNSGTLRYTVNGVEVAQGHPAPGVRLTRGRLRAHDREPRASATNYQDLWWNAAEGGWGVNVTHQDNTLFATLFTYDETGATCGW